MEAESSAAPAILSARYQNLKSSFKMAVRSLLSACSREDVNRVFEGFTDKEKKNIYGMLVQLIKSLHANLEVDFNRFCEETEVGAILDKVDEMIEEQSLDELSSNSIDFGDMKEKIKQVKKDEITYLTSMLQKVEKSNNEMKSRIELLRNNQDLPSIKGAVEKLRRWNAEFEKNI
ncbi:hypothetical protein LUZ60_012778 [Juncus effusus]|nr:hypothetical protein LUZ60_012778 [Juncus effusus]